MQIIEIILFDFILGYILQGFSNYFGIYAFNKKQINRVKFIVSSIITAVVFYIVRLLPISFGIHSILNAIVIFLIGILYLKLQPLNTVIALLVINIILLGTEFANVVVFTSIFGKVKFNLLMNDILYKSILGMPPSIIFAFLNFVAYYLLIIRKRKKRVNNGENRTNYIRENISSA